MNGRASRQLRRDVRRTVGEEAIGIIDAQTNAINHQILPNQNALTSRMQDAESQIAGCAEAVAGLRQTSATEWRRLEERVAVVEGYCTVNDQHTIEVYRDFVAHRDMPFTRRLRWLVLGR